MQINVNDIVRPARGPAIDLRVIALYGNSATVEWRDRGGAINRGGFLVSSLQKTQGVPS
jgi:hypothetical protein